MQMTNLTQAASVTRRGRPLFWVWWVLPAAISVALTISCRVGFVWASDQQNKATSDATPARLLDADPASAVGSRCHSESTISKDEAQFARYQSTAPSDVVSGLSGTGQNHPDRDHQANSSVPHRGCDAKSNGCSGVSDSGCALKDSPRGAKKSDDDSDASSDAEKNQPMLKMQVERYHDSDHIDTTTFTSSTSSSIDDSPVTLRKVKVMAHDTIGTQWSETSAFSVSRDLSEQSSVEAELGSVRSSRSSGLMGSFQATSTIFGSTISASVARDILAESAAAIRANVWQTDFELSASNKFTEQLTSEFAFRHRIYTDRNTSNQVEWSPQYSLDLISKNLLVGYHFDYLSFARNTDDVYWSPRFSLSHSAFAKWSFDWVKTYGRLELEMGRSSLSQTGGNSVRGAIAQGPSSSGYDLSMTAVVGLKPTEKTNIEYTWSSESSAGWNSKTSGLSLKYMF